MGYISTTLRWSTAPRVLPQEGEEGAAPAREVSPGFRVGAGASPPWGCGVGRGWKGGRAAGTGCQGCTCRLTPRYTPHSAHRHSAVSRLARLVLVRSLILLIKYDNIIIMPTNYLINRDHREMVITVIWRRSQLILCI